ncbi:MAG: peptidoglycan-associated lipoprotein Pal [Burkholderiales bacterium]|nr:peptidoglycan-associated lipoprotein Pal [Burkholderiales bacterium]
MNHSVRLFVGSLAVFLAACSSTPVAPPVVPVAPAPAPAPAPVKAVVPAPKPMPAPVAAPMVTPQHLDPSSQLSREHSIFFDFEDATVLKNYAPVVERHGQYLSTHPALKIVIQGNADERGGSEYNLALGQRRADAVKGALRVFGAKDGQIETVSFGKEKPLATGHDEASWQQNRRADIVYSK